jgi:hypothetical protein
MAGNVTGNIGSDYVELNNAATESTLQALLNAIQGNTTQVKNLAGKSGVKNSGAGGNDNLNANNKTVAENTGVFKNLSTFGKSTAESFNKLDSSISPLIGKLLEGNASITVLTDKIGTLNPLLGVAADLFGRLVKFQEENFNAYRTMTNVGISFSGSLTDLRMAAASSYLTLGEFTNVIKNNSESFIRIGGSANEGAVAFSKFSNNFMKSDAGSRVMALGFTAEQANQYLATYVTNAGASNVKDLQTNEKLRKGASQYLEELDRLAEITGKSREELNEQRKVKNLEADAALTAARMKPKEREAFLANYNYMKNMYGAAGADIALAQAQGRSVITKEGQLLTAITGGATETAMQHLNDTAKIYGVGSKEHIAAQNQMSLDIQGGFKGIPDAVFSADDSLRNALTPAIRTTADQMASGLTTNEAFNSRDAKLKEEQIARQTSQAKTMAESDIAMKRLTAAVTGIINPIVDAFMPAITYMTNVVTGLAVILENFGNTVTAIGAGIVGLTVVGSIMSAVKKKDAAGTTGESSTRKGLFGGLGPRGTKDNPMYVIIAGSGGVAKSIADSVADEKSGKNKDKSTKKSKTGQNVEAKADNLNRAKGAGKLLKGLGIVGTLAVGVSALSEIGQTEKDIASGKITKEEARTKQGGAVGEFAGAAAGAALGTVLLPVIGTLVGAAIGGLVGGFGGGKLGEVVGKELAKSPVSADAKSRETKLADAGTSNDQEIIASLRTMAQESEKSRKLQERSVRHLDDISGSVDTSKPPSFYG